MKKTLGLSIALSLLAACAPKAADENTASESKAPGASSAEVSSATLLVWEDLMPEGEDARLAELYSEFYEDMEEQMRKQMTLSEASKSVDVNIAELVAEGAANDTMEQIGTFNVVESLNGEKVRIPGYIVPLDFSAKSEHGEFLLVPYFGACLHTPPPPPNQIVFVKADPAAKIPNIDEPVWLEGRMKTGKFNSDLGNSAYELSLSKLEPYEY